MILMTVLPWWMVVPLLGERRQAWPIFEWLEGKAMFKALLYQKISAFPVQKSKILQLSCSPAHSSYLLRVIVIPKASPEQGVLLMKGTGRIASRATSFYYYIRSTASAKESARWKGELQLRSFSRSLAWYYKIAFGLIIPVLAMSKGRTDLEKSGQQTTECYIGHCWDKW